MYNLFKIILFVLFFQYLIADTPEKQTKKWSDLSQEDLKKAYIEESNHKLGPVAHEQIQLNDNEEKIIKMFGEPEGKIQSNKKSIWSYPEGIIKFENGKVVFFDEIFRTLLETRKRALEESQQKELQEKLQFQIEQQAAKKKLESAKLLYFVADWKNEYGYVTITGQVKNISGIKLENLQAVVMHYTETGEYISSDAFLVEFNPLMPDQMSPFKTMSTYNPLMKRYSISFKEMWGSELPSISLEDYKKATNQ